MGLKTSVNSLFTTGLAIISRLYSCDFAQSVLILQGLPYYSLIFSKTSDEEQVSP